MAHSPGLIKIINLTVPREEKKYLRPNSTATQTHTKNQ